MDLGTRDGSHSTRDVNNLSGLGVTMTPQQAAHARMDRQAVLFSPNADCSRTGTGLTHQSRKSPVKAASSLSKDVLGSPVQLTSKKNESPIRGSKTPRKKVMKEELLNPSLTRSTNPSPIRQQAYPIRSPHPSPVRQSAPTPSRQAAYPTPSRQILPAPTFQSSPIRQTQNPSPTRPKPTSPRTSLSLCLPGGLDMSLLGDCTIGAGSSEGDVSTNFGIDSIRPDTEKGHGGSELICSQLKGSATASRQIDPPRTARKGLNESVLLPSTPGMDHLLRSTNAIQKEQPPWSSSKQLHNNKTEPRSTKRVFPSSSSGNSLASVAERPEVGEVSSILPTSPARLKHFLSDEYALQKETLELDANIRLPPSARRRNPVFGSPVKSSPTKRGNEGDMTMDVGDLMARMSKPKRPSGTEESFVDLLSGGMDLDMTMDGTFLPPSLRPNRTYSKSPIKLHPSASPKKQETMTRLSPETTSRSRSSSSTQTIRGRPTSIVKPEQKGKRISLSAGSIPISRTASHSVIVSQREHGHLRSGSTSVKPETGLTRKSSTSAPRVTAISSPKSRHVTTTSVRTMSIPASIPKPRPSSISAPAPSRLSRPTPTQPATQSAIKPTRPFGGEANSKLNRVLPPTSAMGRMKSSMPPPNSPSKINGPTRGASVTQANGIQKLRAGSTPAASIARSTQVQTVSRLPTASVSRSSIQAIPPSKADPFRAGITRPTISGHNLTAPRRTGMGLEGKEGREVKTTRAGEIAELRARMERLQARTTRR